MIFARISLLPLVLAALVLIAFTLGFGQRSDPRRCGPARHEPSVHTMLAKHRKELVDLRLALLEAVLAAQVAELDAALEPVERGARPRYICRYPIVHR